MNPRTTGILFLVAAALGAFVYFYEIRGQEAREEAAEQAKRLFPDVTAESIEELDFTTSDGAKARFSFGKSGWQLVEPLAFPADESALSGLASNLAQLASEGVIDDAQAPKVYGLGEGAREIHMRAGGVDKVLRIGDKTPVGYDTYVSTGPDGPIYTVSSYKVTGFDKPLDQLRERRVLRFPRERVDHVQVSWPGGSVSLKRRDGEWHLTAPVDGPADTRTVDDLLSDLSFLRADSFIDDPGDKDYGFDSPALAVTLGAPPEKEGGEAGSWSLAVGSPVDGSKRPVRAAESSLYVIPGERLDDFKRSVDAYRYRTLAEFAPGDAARLELAFAGHGGAATTITATRDEAGQWTSKPEAMDPAKAARLVTELSQLRGDSILADSLGADELAKVGLAPPRTVIRVFGAAPEGGGEAKKLAEVQLGDFDPGRGVVARAAGHDTVYRIDYALAEHLPLNLEAFRNRFLKKAGQEEPAAGSPTPPPGHDAGNLDLDLENHEDVGGD